MQNKIRNSDNVIDSRDVIKRIEELEAQRDGEIEEAEEALENANGKKKRAECQANLDAIKQCWEIGDLEGEVKELADLKSLADEGENYASDWNHGEMLINKSYFTEYCQELLEEIGDLPKDLPGYIVIDWDKTAENLEADYTKIDFDGVTFLIR